MKYNYGIYGANEFAFGMMWDTYKFRPLYLHLLRRDDFRIVVDKAYLDMSPRTINGLGLNYLDKKLRQKKKELLQLKKKEIESIKNDLVTELIDIFKKKKFNDTKHNALCKKFIERFKVAIDKINTKIVEDFGNQCSKIKKENITYGKAQKIINMCFKYLYLFDDANNSEYKNIFDCCHMSIDSNILNWFATNDKRNASDYMISWSNLNENNYRKIQYNIKEYCKNSNILEKTNYSNEMIDSQYSIGNINLPFYAEFYIFASSTSK